MTVKYDWQEIKRAYFESDIMEVREFLISFISVNPKNASNGSYAKATKGWRDEKEAIKQTQTKKAKADLENDPAIRISNEKLLEAKKNILTFVTAGLNQIANDIKTDLSNMPILGRVHSKSLKTYWEIVKTELNEPTSYVKNDNNNNDESTSQLAEAVLKLAEAKNKQSKK